jgi:hemolysin D
MKVETFTSTRYGLPHGHVLDVSRDSLTNSTPPPRAPWDQDQGNKTDTRAEGKPSGYTGHIALHRTSLLVDGREEALALGMAVTAEIKAGRRRVISYPLSPLPRYAHERGREG